VAIDRTSHMRSILASAGTATLIALAAVIMVRADGSAITACVNRRTGELKIVSDGTGCGAAEHLPRWSDAGRTGPSGPIGPVPAGVEGPAGPAGPMGPTRTVSVLYVTAGMYTGTSVSRAFCPTDTKVPGGGGVSTTGVGLQQSYPISDETGVIAFGSTRVAGR